MKKWTLGLLLALAVSYFDLWPFPQRDAGELYLVDTLLLEADGKEVRLYAGEVSGSGASVEEALRDMESRTPGQLFLRQTERLIFCGGAEEQMDLLALPEDLPVGVCVYRSDGSADALDMQTLPQVLEAWEKRSADAPTLARAQNQVLLGQTPEFTEVKGETA